MSTPVADPFNVPPPKFVAASPLLMARRYAESDLGGRPRPTDLAWLHGHPLLWLRALIQIRRDTQNHTGQDRLALAPLKPDAGQTASPEYLEAREKLADRTRRRLHFINVVDRRIDEVKAIIGPEPATGWVTGGDIVAVLLDLEEMAARGDLAAVQQKVRWWLDAWERREHVHAETATTLADPQTVDATGRERNS